MKRLIWSAVAAVVASCSPCWAQGRVLVPAGTRVAIYANSEISGNVVKAGDHVHFVAAVPVTISGVAVIAAYAPARGTVVKARHSSGLGRAGELEISIDEVQAVDGSFIKLRATAETQGQNRSAFSIGLGAMGSPGAFFMQGQEAKVAVGRVFDVYVNEEKIVNGTSLMSALPNQPLMPMPSFPGDPVVVTHPVATKSVITPMPAPMPARTGPSIVNVMLCQQVTPDGVPLSTGERFSARTPSIAVWFGVDPYREDRTFEVRWYRGSQLFYSSSAIVRAFQTSAYATLTSSGMAGFTPGAWNVVILTNGRVQISRKFTFTPRGT